MKLKIILMVILFVALIQVLTVGRLLDDVTGAFELENRALETETRSLESQAAALEKDKVRLEAMLASIPKEFWEAFPDPEAGYMEFLNFLASPQMAESGVTIALRRSPVYSASPVPHHESQFSFTFSFVNIDDAEAFFNVMLHQKRFPVKLTTLNLRGAGSGEVTAELALSLHIPARDAFPFLTSHRETL
jgi:hypothetical protein